MNIIELAKQAGMQQDGNMWFSNPYKTDLYVHTNKLVSFAKLVAAHEREACAKLCEAEADDGTEGEWDGCCLSLANKIRERGTT